MARNLRRLRVAKAISQDELAHLAEVERAYVGHLERGGKNPTVLTLAKLAEALNCDVADFFSAVDESKAAPKPLRAGRKKQ